MTYLDSSIDLQLGQQPVHIDLNYFIVLFFFLSTDKDGPIATVAQIRMDQLQLRLHDKVTVNPFTLTFVSGNNHL